MSVARFEHTEHPPARILVAGFRIDDERETLRELARKAGMTMSGFVRDALAERVRRLRDAECAVGTEP